MPHVRGTWACVPRICYRLTFTTAFVDGHLEMRHRIFHQVHSATSDFEFPAVNLMDLSIFTAFHRLSPHTRNAFLGIASSRAAVNAWEGDEIHSYWPKRKF